MYVCVCTAVTDRDIGSAVAGHLQSRMGEPTGS